VKVKNFDFSKGWMMRQLALGWLKVCYDVDKHLPLPSLYGYRLAIGYFRVEEGEVWGEANPTFLC
jgi:hypothetical protein